MNVPFLRRYLGPSLRHVVIIMLGDGYVQLLFLYLFSRTQASNQTRVSTKIKFRNRTRDNSRQKRPCLHQVSMEPRQIMMETETLGVEELQEEFDLDFFFSRAKKSMAVMT